MNKVSIRFDSVYFTSFHKTLFVIRDYFQSSQNCWTPPPRIVISFINDPINNLSISRLWWSQMSFYLWPGSQPHSVRTSTRWQFQQPLFIMTKPKSKIILNLCHIFLYMRNGQAFWFCYIIRMIGEIDARLLSSRFDFWQGSPTTRIWFVSTC